MTTTDLDAVGDAEIVVEAVFEQVDVTRELFAQLDKIWTKYTKQPPPYGLRDPSRKERRVLFECSVDKVATFGKP